MTADRAGFRSVPLWLVALCLGVSLVGMPTFAATSTSVLPSDVRDVIREQYLSPDRETRYLDAAIDLDGDGQTEVLVHVVSDAACAPGGCPTLVFTHLASGYRLLSTIAMSHPPIGVSTENSNGWLNLIVRVTGEAGEARDVELKFDGRSYPADPTVRDRRVKTAKGQGRRLINAFAFDRMKLFAAASR